MAECHVKIPNDVIQKGKIYMYIHDLFSLITITATIIMLNTGNKTESLNNDLYWLFWVTKNCL